MFPIENTDANDLKLSEEGQYHLLDTARWTTFLAIIGFIFIALMLLFMVGFLGFGSALAAIAPGIPAYSMVYLAVMMAFVIALYWYPTHMLFQFSKKIKLAIQTKNSALMNAAFRCQKNMYKYLAILVIIMLSFYVLGFLTMLLNLV